MTEKWYSTKKKTGKVAWLYYQERKGKSVKHVPITYNELDYEIKRYMKKHHLNDAERKYLQSSKAKKDIIKSGNRMKITPQIAIEDALYKHMDYGYVSPQYRVK